MAGREIWKGLAISPTETSPWESRSSMARLVGSDSAEKTASRRELDLVLVVEYRGVDRTRVDRLTWRDFLFNLVRGSEGEYFAFWLTIPVGGFPNQA